MAAPPERRATLLVVDDDALLRRALADGLGSERLEVVEAGTGAEAVALCRARPVHVVALDQKEYAWSLVMGPDRDYLWILAREKRLPEDVRARLLELARGYGIDVGGLIWVEQSRGDG